MTGAWDDKGCKLSFIVATWIGATDDDDDVEEVLVEHSEDILEVVVVLDVVDVPDDDGDIAEEFEAVPEEVVVVAG